MTTAGRRLVLHKSYGYVKKNELSLKELGAQDAAQKIKTF